MATREPRVPWSPTTRQAGVLLAGLEDAAAHRREDPADGCPVCVALAGVRPCPGHEAAEYAAASYDELHYEIAELAPAGPARTAPVMRLVWSLAAALGASLVGLLVVVGMVVEGAL